MKNIWDVVHEHPFLTFFVATAVIEGVVDIFKVMKGVPITPRGVISINTTKKEG